MPDDISILLSALRAMQAELTAHAQPGTQNAENTLSKIAIILNSEKVDDALFALRTTTLH